MFTFKLQNVSKMKNIFLFLILVIFTFSGCKAKYSFNSYQGKKKLNHYNSIQYGKKQYPNSHKQQLFVRSTTYNCINYISIVLKLHLLFFGRSNCIEFENYRMSLCFLVKVRWEVGITKQTDLPKQFIPTCRNTNFKTSINLRSKYVR